MNQLSYLLCVSRAETATALHELRTEAQLDGDLTNKEVLEIAGSIGRRFAALNAAVVNQAPRSGQVGWSAPIRIPTPTHAK